MRIKTIYTDTRANLTKFAKAKGWVEEVQSVVDGVPTIIPNPETLELFLQKFTKSVLTHTIVQPTIEEISTASREQEVELINQAKTALDAKLEVILE